MIKSSRFSVKKKARAIPSLLALVCMGGGLLYGSSLVTSTGAKAQSSYEISNRLKRMENEIATLSRAVYKGETPPPGSLSGGSSGDVEIRLQQMENEIRDLRGKVEQQAHEVRQLRNDMERVTSDLELRLNDMSGGGSAANMSGSNAQGNNSARYTTEGAVEQPYKWSSNKSDQRQKLGSIGGATSSDDAASRYESAFAKIKNRQYDVAEQEFSSFLEQYPNHALSGNAKYWLGETFYVRGQYEKASRIFAEGYQADTKGPKAADNLLKLGMSLAGLGKADDACVALGQIEKENLSDSAPVMRRASQEMQRLGC